MSSVRRLMAGAAGFVLAVTLTWAGLPQAQADPSTVSEAQAELSQYQKEASELEQQYHDVHDRLVASQQQVEDTKVAIAESRTKVAELETLVAQIAIQEWQNHGLTGTAVLLLSENSDELMYQFATTQYLTQTTNDLVQRYQLEQAGLADQQASLEKVTASIQADNDRLAELKEQATLKALAAEQTLGRLQAIQDRINASRSAANFTPLIHDGTAAATVVNFAASKVGGPYVYGGNGPSGYDCSGLTRAAYLQVGISLPHSASRQTGYGTAVSLDALVPGDLIFYYSGPSHVGIYVGGGMIVHASTYGIGIVYSPLYQSPVWGARRLV